MLHPGYPTLIIAVLDYLRRHPEMCVMCIIDREDIVAAAKFLHLPATMRSRFTSRT